MDAPRPFLPSILAAIAASWLQSCGPGGEAVREVTYPLSFEYVDTGSVRGEMVRLAHSVRALDAALAQSGSDDEARRREIRGVLAQIHEISLLLESPGARTNHPALDANIGAFRRDVDVATEAANRDPPNYFYAGRISGSCAYCHR